MIALEVCGSRVACVVTSMAVFGTSTRQKGTCSNNRQNKVAINHRGRHKNETCEYECDCLQQAWPVAPLMKHENTHNNLFILHGLSTRGSAFLNHAFQENL